MSSMLNYAAALVGLVVCQMMLALPAQAQTAAPGAATAPAGMRVWKGDWDAMLQRGVMRDRATWQ